MVDATTSPSLSPHMPTLILEIITRDDMEGGGGTGFLGGFVAPPRKAFHIEFIFVVFGEVDTGEVVEVEI